MPASDVKAYVKRSKNDAADAAAICEAVTRPSMRFVPIKSTEQQGVLMLHRTRDLLVRQRTQLNALRAHLAEFGLVAAQGRDSVKELGVIVIDETNIRLPRPTPGSDLPRGNARGRSLGLPQFAEHRASGSITTVHANGAAQAFERAATLVKASDAGRILDMDTNRLVLRGTIDVVLYMEDRRVVELFYDPMFGRSAPSAS